MSDLLDGVADAAVDVVKTAQKHRKSDRGFMGAMANGIGLVAVRLCIIMMTIIVGGMGYIAETTVKGLHEEIHAVSDDVHDLTKSFNSFSKNITAQTTADRLDITRLQDQEAAGQDRFNDYIRSDRPGQSLKTSSPFRP